LGNALALFGLWSLASGPATPKVEYSGVLGVLSLLSAGAFAGFCAVDYERAWEDESCLLNFLSILFMTLFYLLFFSICYYIGKSENMHQVEAVSYVIPIIMVILLEVNTVIDIWDYRKPRKPIDR
jgi:heme/copper-type cytochrome/quinol oxidase subunit 2